MFRYFSTNRACKEQLGAASDKPPFLAVMVLVGSHSPSAASAVDPHTANVRRERPTESGDMNSRVIPGCIAAASSWAGFFYGNYPSGSGLTLGAVFGRKAGYSAAVRSEQMRKVLDSRQT